MKTNTLLRRTDLDQLARQYHIAAFFLFGSQARGRSRRESDIDVAFLPERDLSSAVEDALYVDLLQLLKAQRLDVVNLRTAPLLLKFAVIRHGHCLAAYDANAVTQFIVCTRRDYLDTEHLRAIFAAYQTKRVIQGRFGVPS